MFLIPVMWRKDDIDVTVFDTLQMIMMRCLATLQVVNIGTWFSKAIWRRFEDSVKEL